MLLKVRPKEKSLDSCKHDPAFSFVAMALTRPGRLKPSFQERLSVLLFGPANSAFGCTEAGGWQSGAGFQSSWFTTYRRPGGPAAAGPGSRSEPEKVKESGRWSLLRSAGFFCFFIARTPSLRPLIRRKQQASNYSTSIADSLLCSFLPGEESAYSFLEESAYPFPLEHARETW